MSFPPSFFRCRASLQVSTLASIATILIAASIVGCGAGGSGGGTTSTMTGTTEVSLLVSSTANDQLSRFQIGLSSLTLTSQSGKTVTVLSAPQSAEFIHLNGIVEPLATMILPQGIYTSASVSLAAAANWPECVAEDSAAGTLLTNGAIGNYNNSTTIVDLPAPIAITGTSMGLVLNLQVSKSLSSFTCIGDTLGQASITPTFNLTPLTIAAQPTGSSDGLALGLRGSVSAVAANGSSFTVTAIDGPTWQIDTNSGTTFQGIGAASQLAAGLPVDMDVAIQQDGSLTATRVAVYDTNSSNLTVTSGPLLFVGQSKPATLLSLIVDNQGPLLARSAGNSLYFNFGNAVFQISTQLKNVQSLPFSASFNASNMVPGQNAFLTTHASTLAPPPTYIPVSTVTLLPQTIDGTVSAVSSIDGFTTYTVTLAPYDLFPNMASQPGQTTLLTDPNTVIVYTDSNTQMLNSGPVSPGGVFRFYGLVFNDNGTLRMDCAQINDGVAE